MLDERSAFEKAIAHDPYDRAAHVAFADWLWERGEDDAAAREASWTPDRQKSEEWLRERAGEYGSDYGAFLAEVTAYVETGDQFSLPRLPLPAYVFDDGHEFWGHFERVTGRRLGDAEWPADDLDCGCGEPDDWGDDDVTGCAC